MVMNELSERTKPCSC